MDEIKRVVLNKETEEDQVVGISLRPGRLWDFIGQKDVVHGLQVAMAAAKKRGEPLEHVLFSGPPGLGKTSLAHIIAHEMGSRITVTSGPAIDRAGDILFIDEIHRLSKTVEEFLYPAMENFKIDFIVDKGPYAKTINFNLKAFTLIGATTRSGLLTTPLRNRFGIFFHLEFYGEEALAAIVGASAVKLNVVLEPDAARAIARRARGTPRIANRLLRRVRDHVQVKTGTNHIKSSVVEEAMSALRIDIAGLGGLDRGLLSAIKTPYRDGPLCIEALAATLNEETDTIVDVVEPFLLKAGFLRRTGRGRELTEAADKYLRDLPAGRQ